MSPRAVLRTALRLAWLALALGLLFAFVTLVWPTRFRYDHMTVDGEAVIVRIDRITGDADMLLPDQGWVPVEGEDGSDQAGPDKI